MELSFLFYLSSGLFLGWSLGASDAANIFGTAVGTKMVKFKTAAIISSIFIIIGAVYAGSGASQTLGTLGSVNTLVSTSQAIVGSIIGWNFFAGKPTDISVLSKIVGTWVFCPILAGVIAVLLYFLVRIIIRRCHITLIRQDCYTRIGLILAGAFGAYALGANNIANVMGVFVVSSPLHAVNFGPYFSLSATQVLFFIGGIAISVGVFTYSHKLMTTVGSGIVKMSPLMAWVAVVSQALVLYLFASQNLQNFLISHHLPSFPLVPVSSSQAIIGAVIGIGLAKGGFSINWGLIGRIAVGWILTPIAAALLCYISLFFLQNVFDLEVCR